MESTWTAALDAHLRQAAVQTTFDWDEVATILNSMRGSAAAGGAAVTANAARLRWAALADADGLSGGAFDDADLDDDALLEELIAAADEDASGGGLPLDSEVAFQITEARVATTSAFLVGEDATMDGSERDEKYDSDDEVAVHPGGGLAELQRGEAEAEALSAVRKQQLEAMFVRVLTSLGGPSPQGMLLLYRFNISGTCAARFVVARVLSSAASCESCPTVLLFQFHLCRLPICTYMSSLDALVMFLRCGCAHPSGYPRLRCSAACRRPRRACDFHACPATSFGCF
jgi:hypothetical protein